MGAINLWNPVHASLGLDALTAFLLGLVHGITPDEHTWPITFGYAVGGHSARKGLRAGLSFSLAFAVQQALASELAYLGLAPWLKVAWGETAANLAIGLLMAAAGLIIARRGRLPHLHLHAPGMDGGLKPWMPAVHGFVAGWAVDPFSIIIFTVLAPAMPSAAWGWAPGLAFGLGTACIQAAAGALFGGWAAAGRGLGQEAAQRIALRAASRSLLWGGTALLCLAVLGLFVPDLDAVALHTGLRVHNLDEIGLPAILTLTALAASASAMLAELRVARRSGRASGAS